MYAKVFRQMFYGSMYAKGDEQLVFICLLAHADRDGNVELPAQMIASMTGMDLQRVAAALEALQAPDPASRSPREQGRRIEAIGDGGFAWSIINHDTYRAMRDEDARRDQTRKAVAKHRDKKMKAAVSRGKPRKAHTEADTEAEAEHIRSSDDDHVRAANISLEWKEAFSQYFWPAYPRKVNRASALVSWEAAGKRRKASDVLLGDILTGLEWWKSTQWQNSPQDKIPHASTWLNQTRWEDAFDETPTLAFDPAGN